MKMKPIMGFIVRSLVLEGTLASTTSSLNVTQTAAYDVDLHECPLSCVDYSNGHSWIPYLSVSRLHRCQEPLLLQLSVKESLDNPVSNILIRTCSLASGLRTQSDNQATIENTKKADELYQSSLETAPACASVDKESQGDLQLSLDSDNSKESEGTVTILDCMQTYFAAEDNCDESFLYAYNNGTVAGLYISAGLGKSTVKSALNALSERLRAEGTVGNRTVAQLCGTERPSQYIIGISIDTTGNLTAVQKATQEWSKGECVADQGT